MKNKVLKTFNFNSTWIAPAGVTQVSLRSVLRKDAARINPAAALLDNGELYMWGNNVNGTPLGDGTIVNKSSPTLVVGGRKFKQIFREYDSQPDISMHAIDFEGNAYGWGANFDGRLGIGNTTQVSSPVLVAGGKSWRYFNRRFGITTEGDLYGMGINGGDFDAAIGDGTTTDRSTPTLVVGGLKWKTVNLTEKFVIGVTENDDAYAWGNNDEGQLGNGTVTAVSSPVLVVGGHKWKKIVTDWFYGAVFGLTLDNDLYSWGFNPDGSLGTNDTLNKSTPTLVVGGRKFIDVGVGVALTEAGELYSWGSGVSIGDGTIVDKSSPVLISGAKNVKKIIASSGKSNGFIDNLGDLYMWGPNTDGQLGTGDAVARSTPTLVVGGKKWKAVGRYGLSTFGITTENDLFAWGDNTDGVLGTGDVASKRSPTSVVGGKKWGLVEVQDVNKVTLPVVPGTSYPITFEGGLISFNGVGLSSQGNTLILEYNA